MFGSRKISKREKNTKKNNFVIFGYSIKKYKKIKYN